MKYIIVDLDNCISDDKYRRKWLEAEGMNRKDQLALYHINCIYDNYHPIEFTEENQLIIFTGRPEIYRKFTKKWLKVYDIKYKGLYMRPKENYDKSPELKEKMLMSLLEFDPIAEIVMVYDDRKEILDMYRKFNIPVTIKQINDYGTK